MGRQANGLGTRVTNAGAETHEDGVNNDGVIMTKKTGTHTKQDSGLSRSLVRDLADNVLLVHAPPQMVTASIWLHSFTRDWSLAWPIAQGDACTLTFR